MVTILDSAPTSRSQSWFWAPSSWFCLLVTRHKSLPVISKWKKSKPSDHWFLLLGVWEGAIAPPPPPPPPVVKKMLGGGWGKPGICVFGTCIVLQVSKHWGCIHTANGLHRSKSCTLISRVRRDRTCFYYTLEHLQDDLVLPCYYSPGAGCKRRSQVRRSGAAVT
jgi:hypothetical protein